MNHWTVLSVNLVKLVSPVALLHVKNLLPCYTQVGSQAEGEAKRYFEHAITLRDTVQFLRRNQNLFPDEECGLGIG